MTGLLRFQHSNILVETMYIMVKTDVERRHTPIDIWRQEVYLQFLK